MKSPTRILFCTSAALALLGGGFVLGGVYASQRAAYTANAGSLVYLHGIHECLAADKPDNARKVTAKAIDMHVEALRNIRTWPSLCLSYILPWDRQAEQTTKFILSQTRTYTSKHQDEFDPETQTFLATQQ